MLTIIAGKPGSGKSYHMASLLVEMLTDWVRYELKHGEMYDSQVYTNIVFKEEGLNETVSKYIGKKVDAYKYVHFCDDSFFNDPDRIYWWEKFEAKSVVIIDEVHKYLARSLDYGNVQLEQELTNWISTHRHSQQVLYFLSQHTDQFANTVLGIADVLLEIVNIKSLTMPFPFSIPMADLEVLKECFGIKTQYYRSNVGNFRGKAIKWSGASQQHLMSVDIFKVYKSHDAGMEESDRPSLKMGRLEGLLWFCRRHGWHLGLKSAVVFVVLFGGFGLLFRLPTILGESIDMGASINRAIGYEPSAVSQDSSASESLQVSIGVPVGSHGVVVDNVPVVSRESVVDAVSTPAVKPVSRVRKFVMLFTKGVMFDDGTRYTVGETFEFEGESETLAGACPVCGVISFESGRRIRFY